MATVEEPVKYPIWKSPPRALVEYYPEGQILLIENGK